MARFLGIEIDQKEYELWIGQLFADAFNGLNGTDYTAFPALKQNDSVDIVIKSSSTKHPDVSIQITDSRPPELQKLDSNRVKLGKLLSVRLVKNGFGSHDINFTAPELSNNKQIMPLCDMLEEFITKNADPNADHNVFDKDFIWDYFHESPSPFGTVKILKIDGLNRCNVNPATAYFVPRSTESIVQALQKKASAQYSDKHKLWLVVVVASLTDDPDEVLQQLDGITHGFARAWFFTFGPSNTGLIFEL